ncbi:MAG: type VI secretion system ATPase TssH, partial [Pseudomonadota bacterium]
VLSPRIPKLLELAWLHASLDFNLPQVRSGHLVLALLSDSEVSRLIKESSREFAKISVETLKARLPEITAGSSEEEAPVGEAGATAGTTTARPGGAVAKTVALDQYTIDLTARARAGHIDPVLGRDAEVRQMVDVLMRRRQNNPILTGEAGVGKTAVVEGFARRIAEGDVPPPLRQVALRILDLGLLQAGASIKGEFENRLKAVIEEVKASPQPIILFIDEAHTLIGAGGAAGQGDAANLLKPALARGELRTIAATTWSEYKKYFEKDAALARRFQVVKIEEPTETQAVIMLRGLTETMENHHKVRILDAAVTEAVRLSHRYLSGRQLPDKAVSVLDTACARVAIGQSATPAALEDAHRTIDSLATAHRVLTREAASGTDHTARLAAIETEQVTVREQLAALEERWRQELDLVKRINEQRARLENADGATPPLREADRDTVRTEIRAANLELETLQKGDPLVQVCVDGDTVAAVLSGWTGIPVGKMLKDEIHSVLALRGLLEERVVGQSHALEAVAQRIRTARAGLEDPSKPVGVFLLVGPSGVGKTETALALADILYGGERNLITINMSEYQEAHTVSGLKGSPPGYVGYGEGGVLTEAVRRKPYSVVLLDEVEKAHPDVMELFFQVFDKGVLDDAEGREIDFKNTVMILTSNAGTEVVMHACEDPANLPEPDTLHEALRPVLQRWFKPAFLGRLKVIPYYPIRDEIMQRIVILKLAKIGRRIAANHGATFTYDPALVAAVTSRCTEVDSGARNVDTILSGTLLPEISEAVLARLAEGKGIAEVAVGVGEDGQFTYRID